MKNKKKIMIGIGVIALFIVCGIGITYSLWSKTFIQTNENTLVSDCFQIVFEEVSGSGIQLENTFPIKDQEGKKLKPYEFSIQNKCNVPVEYQINFETTNRTTLKSEYVKVMFQENEPILLSSIKKTEVTIKDGLEGYQLKKGYMSPNETLSYHLRMWMDENVTQNTEGAMNAIVEGKVSVKASYLSDYDMTKPNASIAVTRNGTKINIDASGSFDSDSKIKRYYYSKDGENYEVSEKDHYTFLVDVHYGNGVEMLRQLHDDEIKKVYVKVEDEFGNMSEVVSENLEELYYDETVDRNLRYIGNNPNNYVSFNNELWRVIGVMNHVEDGSGNKSSRVKLIRDQSIGNYSWDSSEPNINSGYGINEWSKADLNVLLNDYYYYGKDNQMCYIDRNNITSSCSFNQNGIQEGYRDYISNVVWNLGGSNNEEFNFEEINTPMIYSLEKGRNNGKVCISDEACNDSVSRTDSWFGKLGVMFSSDYGYSVSLENRDLCLNVALYSWNSHSSCVLNNWLIDQEKNTWTLSSFGHRLSASYVWRIHFTGLVNHDAASVSNAVYPTFYLASNVDFVSGAGSREEPFKLAIS